MVTANCGPGTLLDPERGTKMTECFPCLPLSLWGLPCPGRPPSSTTHFPKAKHSRVTCCPRSAYVSAGKRALMLGAKSLGSGERVWQVGC